MKKKRMKWKMIKSYYYSLLDIYDDEVYSELKQNNPEKKKAKEYAKKINGKIRTKFYPEDEGYEYQVWQREDLKYWKNIKIKIKNYKIGNKVFKLKFKTFSPILKEGLEILLVGINPHPNSIKKGGYFENNGSLWIQLKEAGITKKRMNSKNILEECIGITNIVLRPTRTSDMISDKEFEEGKKRLALEIDYSKPKVVVFIGKLPYKIFMGKECEYGWQEEKIKNSNIFVMMFPTFRCAKKKKLKILKKLKKAN